MTHMSSEQQLVACSMHLGHRRGRYGARGERGAYDVILLTQKGNGDGRALSAIGVRNYMFQAVQPSYEYTCGVPSSTQYVRHASPPGYGVPG